MCGTERCERGEKGVGEVDSHLRLVGRCRIASAILAASALLDRLRFGLGFRIWHGVAAAVVAAPRLGLSDGLGFRLWHGIAQAVNAATRFGLGLGNRFGFRHCVAQAVGAASGFGNGLCDGLRLGQRVTETVDAAARLRVRFAAEDWFGNADRLCVR